jgi:aerobic carbon-monoxide dehydrogenase medium subunit
VKPPPFGYSRPESLDEAVRLLAECGSDAKVLAGGQSLVPLLSMRLAAPRQLIDINRVSELAYVHTDENTVRVGALARQADVEHDTRAAAVQPLLRQALRLVAHPTIRNRGTVVGSLAHADPASELTAVLAVLGGAVRLASARGNRTVPADQFFVGPLSTSAAADELVVEASFPGRPPGTGSTFVEISRRHGDYATCGVAVCVTVDEDGALQAGKAAFISVGPTPVVVELGDVLAGTQSGGDLSDVRDAVWAAVSPEADIHASAEYRRQLAGVLAVRAVREAAQQVAA